MIEQAKITARQIILLVFVSRIIVAISFFPTISAPPANQDVWMSVILAFPIALFLVGPIYYLSKKFPNQTLIQYIQTLTGKASFFFGILFIWFFLHFTAISANQFCFFLTTAVMPETPFVFFAISLIICCGYLVRTGIEVIVRFAEFAAPIIMITILLIFILLFKDMKFEQLTPVLEEGAFSIFPAGLSFSILTVEILSLSILLPHLNNQNESKKVLFISFSLISLFSVLIAFSILSTSGTDLGRIQNFPFFSATRLVNVGDFLERVEIVHVGIWIIGVLVKVTFYYYLTVISISQLFNLKDYRILVLPVGTIIIPLSFIVGASILEIKEFMSYKIFTWYGLAFIFLIPGIFLLTAWIRKKGVKQT